MKLSKKYGKNQMLEKKERGKEFKKRFFKNENEIIERRFETAG